MCTPSRRYTWTKKGPKNIESRTHKCSYICFLQFKDALHLYDIITLCRINLLSSVPNRNRQCRHVEDQRAHPKRDDEMSNTFATIRLVSSNLPTRKYCRESLCCHVVKTTVSYLLPPASGATRHEAARARKRIKKWSLPAFFFTCVLFLKFDFVCLYRAVETNFVPWTCRMNAKGNLVPQQANLFDPSDRYYLQM